MSCSQQCALLAVVAGVIALVLAAFARVRAAGPRPRAGLVVIVRDRAESVEGACHELLAAAGRAGCQWDRVVILDDCSRDETPLIIERLSRRHPGIEARAATAAEASFLAGIAPPGRATLVVNLTCGDARALADASARALRAGLTPRQKDAAK